MKPGFFINKNAPDCVGGIFVDMGVWKRKINLISFAVGVRSAFDKKVTQFLLLVKREFIIFDIMIIHIREESIWTRQR